MTQYLRAAQAYAAVSSYVAQNASSETTNLRDLFYRTAQKVPWGKGTTRFTERQKNTTERYALIPDAVYSALVTAGVDFSDALYNSATDPTGLSATSEVPTLPNPGNHSIVVFVVGNSIPNGAIGAATNYEFALLQNRLWALGVPNGLPFTTSSPTGLPSSAPQPPDMLVTNRTVHEMSMIIFNFGRDSWRLANQPGEVFTNPPGSSTQTGSPWIDNIAQMKNCVIFPGQKVFLHLVVAQSNDDEYMLRNANGGLSTAQSLTDLQNFIGLWKAAYPMGQVLITTEFVRTSAGNTTTLNSRFDARATALVANKAAYGIDFGVDSRQINGFDCRQPSQANSTVNFQDGTHPTPSGAQVIKPYHQGLYLKAAGFTPDPAVASAFF